MIWDIMVKQWECGRMYKGLRVGLWDERSKRKREYKGIRVTKVRSRGKGGKGNNFKKKRDLGNEQPCVIQLLSGKKSLNLISYDLI